MVQNDLHQKAIALRLKGKSYGEIKKRAQCSEEHAFELV